MLRMLIQTRKKRVSLVHIAKNNKRKRDQNRSPFFTLKYSIIKGLFNLFKWCNSVRVVRGPKREPQNSVVSFTIRSF